MKDSPSVTAVSLFDFLRLTMLASKKFHQINKLRKVRFDQIISGTEFPCSTIQPLRWLCSRSKELVNAPIHFLAFDDSNVVLMTMIFFSKNCVKFFPDLYCALPPAWYRVHSPSPRVILTNIFAHASHLVYKNVNIFYQRGTRHSIILY